MKNEVLIRFETEEQASVFMDWLNNLGEQEYFDSKDYIDNPEDIVDGFEYDYQNNIIDGTKG